MASPRYGLSRWLLAPRTTWRARRLRAAVLAAPDNRLGIRDRSIGLTHFAIAGREHEIAYLRVRDFTETEHGMEVDIRVSKIAPKGCPVTAGRG